MRSAARVPAREQLFGHWYLLATAQGFLDASPRLDSVELLAGPAKNDRIHFHAEFTVPKRRYRYEMDTDAPTPSGNFGWVGRRGLSIFTREWIMAITDDATVLSAYHRGSMVIQEGWALFARAGVDDAHARETLLEHYRTLGMSPRARDEVSFRDRPAGMTASGDSPFLEWATSTTGSRRFQILSPLPR